ncbi:LysR family transcriptional regulator, partial [Burkholderia sp. Ac-20365]|nr:LysR family transcriptional regulator [Burkholderia sp. Ac-20365]
PLPESRVTLHSRVRDPRSIESLKLVTNGLIAQ